MVQLHSSQKRLVQQTLVNGISNKEIFRNIEAAILRVKSKPLSLYLVNNMGRLFIKSRLCFFTLLAWSCFSLSV